MNSFDKGQSTESAVLGILLNRGIPVALPIGVKRFDFVIELDGRLLKAQVKTGRIKSGALSFKLGTTHPVTGKNRPYSKEQVDIFLVYNAQTQKVYRVPYAVVGQAEFLLRLEPAKNGQKTNVHFAKDFEL